MDACGPLALPGARFPTWDKYAQYRGLQTPQFLMTDLGEKHICKNIKVFPYRLVKPWNTQGVSFFLPFFQL